MTKLRWTLVTLLVLTLVSAVGITPTSAAAPFAYARTSLDSGQCSGSGRPLSNFLSGGSGGGVSDGDPDDIIEGNRVAKLATVTSTRAGDSVVRTAVLLCVRVGGVALLLRRMLP